MANIANVKVKQGNVLSLSGSSVEITGSTTTVGGNLNVQGTISASVLTISETIISSSVVYHSGSTKFGDNGGPGLTMDVHQFTGSVNISGSSHSLTGALNIVGNVSGTTFTGSFSGDGSQLTNLNLGGSAVTAITGSTNINVSSTTGNVTASLANSISVTDVTATGQVSASVGKFTTLSASTAEFSGNVLIYGTASLSPNPSAAYIKYTGLPQDKIEIFPGLLVSGSSIISGNLDVTGSVSASSFTGNGAGLTNLPVANLSGVVSLANGGTGINASSITSGQLLIGSGSSLAIGELISGNNIGTLKGSGSITVELSSSITGLTNIESTAITASNVLVTGSLVASSSFARSRITLDTVDAASYNVSSTDQVIIVTFSTDDDVTIFLPSATQIDGRELIIKRGNANQLQQKIQITPSGSETVDLETAGLQIWGPFESKTLIADSGSANWVIV
jgi:hypothetical protein